MSVLNFGQTIKRALKATGSESQSDALQTARFDSALTKQKGIGLLELMLALAVIALLLLMATRYYTVTRTSQQGVVATQDIGTIVASIAKWRGGQPDYSAITTKKIMDMGGFPSGFKLDGDVAKGPRWLNCPPVTVRVAPALDNSAASLTINNLDTKICAQLENSFGSEEDSWVRVGAPCSNKGGDACGSLVLHVIGS